MALFGRRKAADDGPAVEAEVAALARKALAERGIETTVQGAPGELHLVTADTMTYFVYNLVLKCRAEPRRRWPEVVAAHIEGMMSSRDDVPHTELTPDDVRRQIRARILPAAGDATPIDLSYARPFAPGLVVVLCMDYPQTVSTLSREHVEALPLDIDELYRFGLANTDGEPIDEHSAIRDGVALIGGGSLFVASKAADMTHLLETVIGAAPHGVVFSVPHRQVLLYAVPTGPELVASLNTLLQLTLQLAHDSENPPPGGVLSHDVFFWADGEVDRIGGWEPETQSLGVDATGRFGAVLERLTSA